MRNTLCPECGPNVIVDEDGCCATCGGTATGAWLDNTPTAERPKEATDENKHSLWRSVGSFRQTAERPKEATENKHSTEIVLLRCEKCNGACAVPLDLATVSVENEEIAVECPLCRENTSFKLPR